MSYLMESLVAIMFVGVAWVLLRELRHHWHLPTRNPAKAQRRRTDIDPDQPS